MNGFITTFSNVCNTKIVYRLQSYYYGCGTFKALYITHHKNRRSKALCILCVICEQQKRVLNLDNIHVILCDL